MILRKAGGTRRNRSRGRPGRGVLACRPTQRLGPGLSQRVDLSPSSSSEQLGTRRLRTDLNRASRASHGVQPGTRVHVTAGPRV